MKRLPILSASSTVLQPKRTCAPIVPRVSAIKNAFSDFGFGFSDMLSSFFEPVGIGALSNSVLRCEKCGCSFNDIVKSGKIGCADCYETFYDKLMPSIERIHGRTPPRGQDRKRLACAEKKHQA